MLCFDRYGRSGTWKDYVERSMNKEDDWDDNVEGDAVDSPVVCVSRGKVTWA